MSFNIGVDILPTVTDSSLNLGSSSNPWTVNGNVNGNATSANKANLTTTANAVAYFSDAAGTFAAKAVANGALYATSTASALTFGTLPTKQGGTGCTTLSSGTILIGNGTKAITTRNITNNTTATSVTASTNIPNMNTLYYSQASINNARQTSAVSIYAPTTAGTASTQALVSGGSGTAPSWTNISPSVTLGTATSSATQTISIGVLGQTATAQSLTKASTSVYGCTILSDSSSTSESGKAATPKGVWAAINAATVKIGTQTKYPGKSGGDTFDINTLVVDLGLNRAFQYKGVVTTYPIGTSGYVAGDVVIVDVSGTTTNNGVYTYDGSSWTKLGSSQAYKLLQSAVSDPTSSGTATSFITSISQDQNGVITAAKSGIPNASSSAKGLMKVSTGLTASSGAVSVVYGSSAPANLGSSASVGTANSAARSDHVHKLPTPADIGAAKVPITANMGTISNTGSSPTAITVNKTVTGVTSDMTVDRVMVGTPSAFASDITVITATNNVKVVATIGAGMSSTISVKLSNNTDVTGT